MLASRESDAIAGNCAFVALVVAGARADDACTAGHAQPAADPDALPAAFVWENRLVVEPSITRLILIGVILIVLMNARPQGLLGTRARGDRLMAERLLELHGVSKSFGGLHVHRATSTCTSTSGEIVSVIGPNGAGKTTLFNLITGVYAPDAGDIRFAGESLLGLEPHEITRRGIARTFQTLRLFLNMTVKENVMAAAYSHTKAGIFRSILRTPGHAARGARDRGARRGAARLLRRAADGLPLEPARLQPLVREPAPARDRAGDGDEAAAAAPRRAGRGDEPGRDARDHRADRAAARGGAATRSS